MSIQVRTCDQTNRCSGWVSFGGNPETAADLYANPIPELPAAPTNLAQFQSDGTALILGADHQLYAWHPDHRYERLLDGPVQNVRIAQDGTIFLAGTLP